MGGILICVVAFEPGPEIGYAFATDDHIGASIRMQLKNEPAVVIGKYLTDSIYMDNKLAVDAKEQVPVQ